MPNMSLDLRYLRYAMIAAEHGSFRRVAKVLGVPQSTVSRRILILEHKIGFSIFERDYRGVRVTKAGSEFLKQASMGVIHFEQAIRVATSTQRGERGEIKIGMLTALTARPLDRIFRQFHHAHKGLKVRIREGTSKENLQRLTSGEVDIVFIAGAHSIPGYKAVVLWSEGVFLALPETHHFCDQDGLEWADARDETFVVSSEGSGPEVRDYLIQRLAGLGFSPTIDMHDVGRDSLMNLVAMGYGLTVSSQSTLGIEWPGVVFRKMFCPEGDLPISAVWSPTNSNPALKHFMAITNVVSREMHHPPRKPKTVARSGGQ
ncbi:LysR family transcriptional regulator [Neorhizobium galegae]|uniref:LysR family transcriptional regulator n=1 Tax=Neorhizobium galegae TaxID=399 RepID=A0A6A1TXP7_NEOGA|nr:LysR family transcriptional regulator [Neorhizobium galegae]KAB1089269.1 LysR family transcriptional regulator [Neorhizobium galegae]